MTYQEFKVALEIFQLGERATLAQIKSRYRRLAKDYHPDHGNGADPEMINRVNEAYALLIRYCDSYRYGFSEEEFLEQVPSERLRRQFADDPVWGGGKD
jgi:DnaJ-class molecular chaperone